MVTKCKFALVGQECKAGVAVTLDALSTTVVRRGRPAAAGDNRAMSAQTPPLDHPAVVEPMRSRWSPSIFADDSVSDEVLLGLLSAAASAPSAGNGQPWAYVVTRRGTTAHDVVVDSLSRGNSGWVPTAPIVIVAAALTEEYEGRKPAGDYAFYDLGQSVGHLTLQAHAVGLYAHQFAGFDHDQVARGLGIPSAFRVLTGIAIGQVGDAEDLAAASESDVARHTKERVRRPLADTAHDGIWGTPFLG